MLAFLARTVGVLFLVISFFVAGFFVNVLQALSLLLVRPISLKAFRVFNLWVVSQWWCFIPFLAESWAGIKLRVFGSKEDLRILRESRAIVLGNHRGSVDWLFGWTLGERLGVLSGMKGLVKQVLMYVPFFGWSWYFLEFVALRRRWDKDQKTLESAFSNLQTYSLPYWLAIFAEGTRLTPEKLKASQEFAKKKGLPVLQHCLLPRTKGFAMAVMYLRDALDHVVDMTVSYPAGKEPTLGSMLMGRGGEAHLHLRSRPIAALPKEEAAVGTWLINDYADRDKLLQHHLQYDEFPGTELVVPKRCHATIVVAAWSLLTLAAISYSVYQAFAIGSVGHARFVTFLGVISVITMAFALFQSRVKATVAKKSQ